jgi:triosephosphate isomerase
MSKTIVANWKMNCLIKEARDLAAQLAEKVGISSDFKNKIVLCPAYPYLLMVEGRLAGTSIALGGQDCSPYTKGAYTGDVSPAMLRDIGCTYVILGHSERRTHHQESDDLIKEKANAAIKEGLQVIFCIGESLEEKEQGRTLEKLKSQLEFLPENAASTTLMIAYEPVWAIGSGQTPTLEQIQDIHHFLYTALQEKNLEGINCLYGGSVNSQNAHEIMALPHVDGVLVGGASLHGDEFWKIAS